MISDSQSLTVRLLKDRRWNVPRPRETLGRVPRVRRKPGPGRAGRFRGSDSGSTRPGGGSRRWRCFGRRSRKKLAGTGRAQDGPAQAPPAARRREPRSAGPRRRGRARALHRYKTPGRASPELHSPRALRAQRFRSAAPPWKCPSSPWLAGLAAFAAPINRLAFKRCDGTRLTTRRDPDRVRQQPPTVVGKRAEATGVPHVMRRCQHSAGLPPGQPS
eukprot:scaffold4163_cov425-Prasinococcus_capsulatus_cf.AAC.8